MTAPRRRLDGLKLISLYLGLSVRAVRKLASPRTPLEWRLPLFRISLDEHSGRRSAFTDDLDQWVERFRARALTEPRLPRPRRRQERVEHESPRGNVAPTD